MPIPTSETFKFKKYFSESYVSFRMSESTFLDEEKFDDLSSLSWSSANKENEAPVNRSNRISSILDKYIKPPTFDVRSSHLHHVEAKYFERHSMEPRHLEYNPFRLSDQERKQIEPRRMSLTHTELETRQTETKERKSKIPVLKTRLPPVKAKRNISFNDSGVCNSFSSNDSALRTSTPEKPSQRRVSFIEKSPNVKIPRAHPNPLENTPVPKKPKMTLPNKTKSILKKPEATKTAAQLRHQKRSEDFLRWRSQRNSSKDEVINKANVNWDIKPLANKISQLEKRDDDNVRAEIESLRQTLEKITSFLDTKFGDKK